MCCELRYYCQDETWIRNDSILSRDEFIFKGIQIKKKKKIEIVRGEH